MSKKLESYSKIKNPWKWFFSLSFSRSYSILIRFPLFSRIPGSLFSIFFYWDKFRNSCFILQYIIFSIALMKVSSEFFYVYSCLLLMHCVGWWVASVIFLTFPILKNSKISSVWNLRQCRTENWVTEGFAEGNM